MARRLLALGALCALALCACTRAGSGGPSGDASAGGGSGHPSRFSISAASDPKNLNPALASSTPTLELSAFLFSYTVVYDEHARPVPDVVTEIPTVANGDVSKDGLTITYKLRRGVMWHDGQGDVQCKDMRLTWQVMTNPKNNVNTTDGWKDIKDVDCRDPYVAVVHLARVYAPFLQQLWSLNGNGPILPEHLLGALNAAGNINNAPYNAAPVGSGPYKFVSWERGSAVRLAANPAYFRGKPAIAEVVYKIIPDQNTLATQLETHELDLGYNLSTNSYDRVRQIAGYTTVTPVVYTYDHIDFNFKKPLFQDVRVRRALTYAIDRPALLAKVRHGLGELSNTFLDPTLSPAAQTQVTTYPYAVAKAKALLDAAGWKSGPDGIRVKNGQRLSFALSTQTESVQGQAIQEQVQRYWHIVGADAQIKNYPTALFFDNTAKGPVQGGRYDVALFAWVGAADIDNSAIYSAHYFAPHGQNALFWNNPVATRAMDDANETVDPRKRIDDYRTVQREFAQDDPSIILWFRKDLEVYNSALKGFSPTPVITIPFWSTWRYHY